MLKLLKINKYSYSYNYNLIDNIKVFIKLSNGIQLGDRDKYWYKNGKRHRENDKPAVEWKNGYKQWWINGELHRENDKPAVESAIEYANGGKEWWINGKFIKQIMMKMI